jgi:F-type H+-transporting ATPase subunit alpha
MVELLKQPQFQPMPVELQVASIYAGTKGYMDSLKVESVRAFEAGLHEHLKSKSKEVLSAIVASGKLEKATEEALAAAIKAFKETFVKDNASAAVAPDAEKKSEGAPEKTAAAVPAAPAGVGKKSESAPEKPAASAPAKKSEAGQEKAAH